MRLMQELQESLIRFWNQEEFPDLKARTLSEEDQRCEEHYQTTDSRNPQGRYIVRLPIKDDLSKLGDSKTAAYHSFKRLSGRFSSNSLYQQRYVEFIEEYKKLEHMTPVPDFHKASSPINYLPYHGVLREHSSTTKLRVVFNGSAHTSTGLSINDLLYTGQKLQTDVADVILWSRTHRYLFSTDIVKMYRQILIHPDDRDLQRILWVNSTNRIISYHLNTVTYGLSCAPFLALRTIEQLISDEGHRFPAAIPPLTKGRYVDDIIGGADTLLELEDIRSQLIQLCNTGCLPLQKWNSNCSNFLSRNHPDKD